MDPDSSAGLSVHGDSFGSDNSTDHVDSSAPSFFTDPVDSFVPGSPNDPADHVIHLILITFAAPGILVNLFDPYYTTRPTDPVY